MQQKFYTPVLTDTCDNPFSYYYIFRSNAGEPNVGYTYPSTGVLNLGSVNP